MQPCPWCVLQRLIFVAIGVFAVLGLVWRGRPAAASPARSACCSRVAGIAAALWQHFVAAKSASCNLTLADKIISATQLDRLLPDVFEARASCADAAVSLLGVPYCDVVGARLRRLRDRAAFASCAGAPEVASEAAVSVDAEARAAPTSPRPSRRCSGATRARCWRR